MYSNMSNESCDCADNKPPAVYLTDSESDDETEPEVNPKEAAQEKSPNRCCHWLQERLKSVQKWLLIILGWIPWEIVLPVLLVLLFVMTALWSALLPTPLSDDDCVRNPTHFCTPNAVRINANLTDMGNRNLATKPMENNKIKPFFKIQLEKIIAAAHPSHKIEIFYQNTSGSYNRIFFHEVQNIVVRFTPSGADSNSSLLINSNYDTFLGSPGAAADGLMVAVMMETLRAFSRAESSFRNSIIFVFSGAKEVADFGIGALTFIKYHPWSKHCKMFINLNNAGSSGREFLVRSTAKSNWILNLYRKAAKYPAALVTVQDLYYAGMLLYSSTDFDIFQNIGHIPGIELGLLRNGYVYHTSLDVIDNISPATYQNIGDNLLSLSKAISSQQFPDEDQVVSNTSQTKGDQVFFDYIGWFLVHYSLISCIVFNVVVSVASIFLMILSLTKYAKHLDLTLEQISQDFLKLILVQVVSVSVAFTVTYMLGFIYNAVGSMRWFYNVWLIGGIYYIPVVGVLMAVPYLYYTRFFKLLYRSQAMLLTSQIFVQMYLHAHCLVLIVAVWILTVLAIKSSFLLMMIVTMYALALLINTVYNIILKNNIWIILHLVGQLPVFLYFGYFFILMIECLVPLQGRTGFKANPEFVIGPLSCVVAICQFGLLAPLVLLFRRPLLLLYGIIAIFVVALILMCTPLGFPYKASLAEQRFFIYHINHHEERSHNYINSDSGFIIVAEDRHQFRYIEDFVPELKSAVNLIDNCTFNIICGMPEERLNYKNAKWIHSQSQANINNPWLERRGGGDLMAFDVLGSPFIRVYVQAINGFTFGKTYGLGDIEVENQYSFSFSIINNKRFQFAFYVKGPKRDPNDHSNPIAANVLTTKPCHTKGGEISKEYQQLIDKFPDWTSVEICKSSYFIQGYAP